MGFVWDVTKGIFTLGGSIRLADARERYEKEMQQHNALCLRIASKTAAIEALVVSLKLKASQTKSQFHIANKIIAPPALFRSGVESPEFGYSDFRERRAIGIQQNEMMAKTSGGTIAVSALAGTSAAMLAWQGAQVVGIASTGTAMFGLHGAAATNAGWALFGGGSLATGGGGMALGHLLLPGAGIAIAIGFGAFKTNSDANKLNRIVRQIKTSNAQNEIALSKTDANHNMVRKALDTFETENARWSRSFVIAKKKLRRFGWFSSIYRYLRFKIAGVYYTPLEWEVVAELEKATREFFANMSVVRNES